MADPQEKNLLLGQEGLYIEQEQDPDAADGKVCTNAPDGALKHAVNVDYQGKPNLHRRKGYQDAFYNPDDGTMEVHDSFNAAGAVVNDKTWQDVIDETYGIRGLDRYTYLDNRQSKGGHDYDLERYTIFATKDDAEASYPETHTYHWRNAATPNIRQLEAPVLDRLVYGAGFSDVDVRGMERSRFWNYTMWGRGGESETYLLGTYGGHYDVASGAATAPAAWNTGAGNAPDAGSFDAPAISANCRQRRVMYWYPEWYFAWATLQGYAVGGGIEEIGLSYWMHPFIWYHVGAADDYDDFYAEPCGRYLEPYNESLFMARIERTYNSGDADDAAGTPTWIYEPSAIMWSFWGYATGMELGTPPAYPFRIPEEPNERVWGCGARGYPLNRHIYFRRGDGTPIVGLKEWNGSLYVMKPTGFGQITGTYSGNFGLMDLRMSQGPAGSHAWCKADEGIYYVTKKGFYLFDGNPASQNRCLSDLTVKKIFEDDIDWASATDFLSGELVGVSIQWDKQNSQVIISYPKNGEQGGQNQPLAGTPTRCLVYDTLRGRFTEWDVPLSVDTQATPTIAQNASWGIMLGGQDPTDDDYMMGTHPTGNFHGNNDTGRLLWRINTGYRDNVALDSNGDADEDTGDRIIYDATTKDYTIGSLQAKQAVTRWRQVIYANNGGVKRKVIYNYYDDLEEEELTYPATGEDGYYQEEPMNYPSPDTGNAALFSVVSFKYYHDEDTHMDGEAIDTDNTNIYDGPIQFVAASVDVMPTEGDSAG